MNFNTYGKITEIFTHENVTNFILRTSSGFFIISIFDKIKAKFDEKCKIDDYIYVTGYITKKTEKRNDGAYQEKYDVIGQYIGIND